MTSLNLYSVQSFSCWNSLGGHGEWPTRGTVSNWSTCRKDCVTNWKRNNSSWETNVIYPGITKWTQGWTSEPQTATHNICSKITSEYEAWKVADAMLTSRKAPIFTTLMIISNRSGRHIKNIIQNRPVNIAFVKGSLFWQVIEPQNNLAQKGPL